MIRKLMLATAALVALGLAPVAQAQRFEVEYGRRPSVPALAQELALATSDLQRTAQVTLRGGPRAADLLDRLNVLDRRADRFYRSVHRSGVGSPMAERDLDRLLRAHEQVAQRIAGLRSRPVRADFRRVTELTNRMVRSWDVALGYPGRPPIRPV